MADGLDLPTYTGDDSVARYIRSVRLAMQPQPIDTAPPGDGWILGYVGHRDFGGPWAICTRCDEGWLGDDHEPVEPLKWVPLPDPQPEPTGWRRAEGEVVAECAWLGDEKVPIWLVSVVKSNGEYDDSREPIMVDDPDTARERANNWAVALGLPWREGQMIHARGKVVPILAGRALGEGQYNG